MAVRKANATWEGTLKEGAGKMRFTGYEGPFTYASRFEEGQGTNPEELIGAAHAGCFSMFLSAQLTSAGYTPTRVHTVATVHLGRDDVGPKVTHIELDTEAEVPNLDEKTFMDKVEVSKQNCPISRALAGPEISVNAKLVS
ncbi:MAG: OsmC family protein [Chloroflexi bacterium]|nr:OsmC family protein [Chloroflexota bacterium]MCI0579245.1 OsmC family protein [Chloroflexota bacterium]MCI0647102.1 OsmC family protein [Chloroflexota bacterium]MCI0725876.1 OsmC family protein [Chloroflexota bacterium]